MPPVAPTDPRTGQDLPAFGQLPTVARLDDVVTRVLAPNPSPMTLDGTNTYVVAAPGVGAAAVIDPGPDDDGHLDRIAEVVAAQGLEVAAVVGTHHHVDHVEALHATVARLGGRAVASTPDVAGADGVVLADGDRVDLPGLDLRAVATPGHCSDHLAFRVGDTGALLTGDHVLGRGTSVVAHPDGDLEAYLASLRRVLDLGPDVLYPGHGPELTEDPGAVVRYYLDHRAHREQQILDVLSDGPATTREIVEVIYAAVDPVLWPAADRSTEATIDRLVRLGTVRRTDERSALT